MLHQNIHNDICTRLYGVLTQTTLWKLITVSTSNLIPKITIDKETRHIYLVIIILHALPIYSPSEEWSFWEHRTNLKLLAFSNELTTRCQFLSVESNVFIRKDTSNTRSLHLENECAQIIYMLTCTKATYKEPRSPFFREILHWRFARCTKTPGTSHPVTWRYIPEKRIRQLHRIETLKTRTV